MKRALALGQRGGPGLANKSILQDGLSPKAATQQIPEMGQPDSETSWSSFSGFLLPVPLFNGDTPSLQSPLSFCTRWSVRACPASFLRLSSLPSSTPHPVEVGPSSQDPPRCASLAQASSSRDMVFPVPAG